MPTRALRGATTVYENSRPAMLEASEELLRKLIEQNGMEPEQVVSVVFTATPDLTAAYPAEAARKLGWTQCGLLSLQEMQVEGGLERCLRVLVLWDTDRPQAAMRHCYLRGAAGLRPDLDPG